MHISSYVYIYVNVVYSQWCGGARCNNEVCDRVELSFLNDTTNAYCFCSYDRRLPVNQQNQATLNVSCWLMFLRCFFRISIFPLRSLCLVLFVSVKLKHTYIYIIFIICADSRILHYCGVRCRDLNVFVSWNTSCLSRSLGRSSSSISILKGSSATGSSAGS